MGSVYRYLISVFAGVRAESCRRVRISSRKADLSYPDYRHSWRRPSEFQLYVCVRVCTHVCGMKQNDYHELTCS